MAVGDITVYQDAKGYMLDGGWATTDNIAIDLIRAVSTPTAADVAPAPASYTLATSTEGEQVLDTWANTIVEAAGTVTFDDTGASVTWAQGGGNSTDVRWAIVFNTTNASNQAICFIDLGSNRDLTAGSLTLTWNASGIFTMT